MRRLVSALTAWTIACGTAVAQDSQKVFGHGTAPRVFGRVGGAGEAPPRVPAHGAQPSEIDKLRAEVAELRARGAADATRPTAQQYGQRVYLRGAIDLSRLSAEDRERYIKLDGQNKGIGLGVTLTVLSAAALLGTLLAYFYLLNTECGDDYVGYYDCSMPTGVFLAATSPPIAGLVSGSILLRRRLPRRREFRYLEKRAAFRPAFSRNSVSLTVSF